MLSTKILFTEYIERFLIFACISCFIIKGFIIKPAYLCNTFDLLISHVRNKMSYVRDSRPNIHVYLTLHLEKK